MWVWTVAKWPPARVAIQPPSVENSNDCGKWRRVRPCGRRPSSSSGPVVPARISAEPETSSIAAIPLSRRRSSETVPR